MVQIILLLLSLSNLYLHLYRIIHPYLTYFFIDNHLRSPLTLMQTKNGHISSLTTLQSYFNFISISITDKYRYIDIIMPHKFHFGRRVGSKGSRQKSKTSCSDSNEARLCRALLEEEEQMLYQERVNIYSKEYEERQATLDRTLHRRVSLRSSNEDETAAKTAMLVVPLSSSNYKKLQQGLPAEIDYHQTSSMSSMSDHSDKEEILRLKRKIVNQNHIIKKHKLESMENRKAVMNAKKEYEKKNNNMKKEHNAIVAKIEIEAEKKVMKKNKELRSNEKKHRKTIEKKRKEIEEVVETLDEEIEENKANQRKLKRYISETLSYKKAGHECFYIFIILF